MELPKAQKLQNTLEMYLTFTYLLLGGFVYV